MSFFISFPRQFHRIDPPILDLDSFVQEKEPIPPFMEFPYANDLADYSSENVVPPNDFSFREGTPFHYLSYVHPLHTPPNEPIKSAPNEPIKSAPNEPIKTATNEPIKSAPNEPIKTATKRKAPEDAYVATPNEQQIQGQRKQVDRIALIASKQLPVESLTSVRKQFGLKHTSDLASLSGIDERSIRSAEKNISRIHLNTLKRIIKTFEKLQETRRQAGLLPIAIPSEAWIKDNIELKITRRKDKRKVLDTPNNAPDFINRVEMIDRFLKAMVQQNLLQADIINKSKVSQSTMSRVLNPDERVNLENIIAIAKVLKVDIEDLIDYDSPLLKKMKT